jgi:thymidylate synthase (FAD)
MIILPEMRSQIMQSDDKIIEELSNVSSSEKLVELLSCTPGAQELIVYCARVSAPQNQLKFDTSIRLINYLLKHKHWSPFEMGTLTIQVKTSRGISPQLLRHRSFTFQEFSQRYAAVDAGGLQLYAARRQDVKNRQNSIDDLSELVKQEWLDRQDQNWKSSFEHYTWALDNGIAKECARFVLPLGCSTTLYMSGSIRSWMTYFMTRLDKSTQLEHREIAAAAFEVFEKELPDIAQSLRENYTELFS